MIYVLRDGHLVEKTFRRNETDFPTPMLSPRFEAFESPVTGAEISSWGARERDMRAADAVDPRDLPRRPFEERRKKNARHQH
jgi:hypothetical protein